LLTELRHELTANEWAVLADISVMRVAAATDLQRLQELRQPVSVRQFRRLLAGLNERRVLYRLDRVVGGRARGSAGYVYVTGSAGQQLLANESDASVRRPWTPRPSWLSHALAASHLLVVLRELEHDSVLLLRQFQTEPACWRTFTDADGKATLKPDAFVRVDQGDYTDSYFIEVDCATESPATLSRKCAVYQRYWEAGVEQEGHGVFPQVLWLVPSTARAAVLRRVVTGQGPDQALHAVATYDRAADIFREEPP
jgi:hypothetical protein